jgi:tRNA modification GTPase
VTKIDSISPTKINNIKSGLSIIYNKVCAVSSKTGEGIPELVEALGIFSQEYFGLGGSGLIGRIRQRTVLEEALGYLNSAISPDSASDIELFAEDLRLAARALGRLTGRIDVEDILDVIFRDFCIGK